jgi:Tfp pilus assembly protein PilV
MMKFITQLKNNPSSDKSTAGEAGFTLIETLVAIFILTLTIGGLLTLAANGYYSVRYARNQIVANNLIQESLEYFHNNRDTVVQQGVPWATWIAGFNVSSNGTVLGGANSQGCYATGGCIVDPYSSSTHVRACSGTCPTTTFYANGLYGYTSSSYPMASSLGAASATTYVRKITTQLNGADQMVITSTVTWKNGNAQKTSSQSILMTNWK